MVRRNSSHSRTASRLIAALIATTTLVGGCCGSPEVWTGKFSCASWATFNRDFSDTVAQIEEPVTDEEAMANGIVSLIYLISLAVPLALDTVMLPVTLVHDIFFRPDGPSGLRPRDKELAMKQAQMSLETGRTGQRGGWSNLDSGNSGSFTPTRTYQQPNGQYCREYTQEIMVGGEKKQSYGTACRQPDGTWQVQ